MKLLTKVAGMCMFLALGFTSCKEEVEIKNSLSVSPDTPIEFSATGNKGVTLTVETDADKWSYTAPEWVVAEQSGNNLVVNVQDNDGDARNGSIELSAGTADMVKINVLQHSSDGGDEVVDGKIAGSIKDESGKDNIKIKLNQETTKATVKLKLTFDEALQKDANVSVFVDKEYLDEYNYTNETSCVILPDNALSATEWPVTISTGETEAELSFELDGTNLEYVVNYLLPLKVKVVSGDINFSSKKSRVNYVVSKIQEREIKQMVCLEFNDVNPLNVLEYKLEDGSYFFDAVVLFSGNMAWDSGTASVRFNASSSQPVINYNTDALIREWETYIKPIHDAGIKVYMGIMPHHTRAGISTLSYKGCKWFAEEVAQIVHECQMDGVFLDDEYVGTDGGYMTPDWSDPVAGSSYFAYQMKKQMKLACDWPTEVSIFQYGGLTGYLETITDHEDNTTHVPGEFADIMVANYLSQGTVQEGQTLKNCTGISLELARQIGSVDESQARQIKEDGYGWMMYFAFNPDPNHHSSNLNQSLVYFSEVARGCYNQELAFPTHYYKKIGEGEYDPIRYPLY